jgi:hypothetical protein
VLDLVLALQNLLASRLLPSPNGCEVLLSDLSRYISQVVLDAFDIKSVAPLLEKIINNALDAEIWYAVYDLVAESRPPQAITPPTALENTTFETPFRHSSASQIGTEQTHDEVDQRILEELTGRVYYDVGGFYERYFEGKAWTKKIMDIYEEAKARYAQGRWSGWPENSNQDLIFEWLMTFQDAVFTELC